MAFGIEIAIGDLSKRSCKIVWIANTRVGIRFQEQIA
jgi:hypothetical protein